MRRIITFLVALVGALIVTAVILIAYLTQVLNPNELKPEIEAQSLARGIPLKISGDIAWQWYPYLGLSVEQVQLGEDSMLSVKQMSARVALKPLWQRRVRVMSLQVSGARLNLVQDIQGRGNWQKLIETQSEKAAAASSSAAKALKTNEAAVEKKITFGVERIQFDQMTIDYRDQISNSHIVLVDQSLSVDRFELEGGSFHWSQSGNLQVMEYPPLSISTNGNLVFKEEGKSLTIESFAMKLSRVGGSGAETIKAEITGEINLETMSPLLKLDLPAFSLREWFSILALEDTEMASAEALKSVGLSATVAQAGNDWLITNLILVLDKSRISGQLSMLEKAGLVGELKVDKLNLDYYLPPVIEESKANPSAVIPSQPLDLEPLRSVQGELRLSVDQLQAKQLQFQNIKSLFLADKGIVTVKEFTANFYEGALSMKGSLDARKPAAQIKMNGSAKSVAIKPVLTLLADESRLSGVVNLQAKAVMSGDRVDVWLKELNASVEVTAQKMVVETVDVERTSCELAALINGKESPQLPWKGATTLSDLTSTIEVKGDVVDIRKLQAGVENLAIRAQGKMDLESGEFDIPLDVSFIGDVDPTRRCQVRERWRNQPLPIRCKGNSTSLSAKACLPDRKRLDDLLRNELKGQAKEKIKEKLQNTLGVEGEGVLEGLLRGLRN